MTITQGTSIYSSYRNLNKLRCLNPCIYVTHILWNVSPNENLYWSVHLQLSIKYSLWPLMPFLNIGIVHGHDKKISYPQKNVEEHDWSQKETGTNEDAVRNNQHPQATHVRGRPRINKQLKFIPSQASLLMSYR